MDNPPLSDLEDEGLTSDLAFLSGGGEMGELLRSKDWSKTALGPVDRWPQSLKTAVRIMLTSRQPIWIGWGEPLIKLYNDPYKAIVRGKHPVALGQSASVVWREIWPEIEPMLRTAMGGIEGTYVESQLLIMERNGYPEETYYTFSYSPIPDDQGAVGGIFCANTDDTDRVIGERQLALLKDLAARTADARTFYDACRLSAISLQNDRHDFPFALMYLAEQAPNRFVLAATSGIEPNRMAAAGYALDSASVWPLAEVICTQRPSVISDLSRLFDHLPTGPWKQPPHQAVVVPIGPSDKTGKAGVLIVGLNPFRIFDDRYQRFVDLVAGQIAASLANAQRYEEERKRAEALAELDRAKTAFFSNVSHELRTPLTLMLGPLEELKAQFGRATSSLDVTQYQQVDLVHRNGLRLLKLVNQLLDFSRIEAGRAQALYEETDLAAFTVDLASVFRSAIEKAGLSLIVDCPPLSEPVYVDRDMWEKIVLNLLSNAFKFTFEGEIEVALRPSGTQVELSIRDTGTGIPEDQLGKIFERFNRVAGSQGRTYEGTGIGLSLVQELARLHGGSVSVESVYGKGSTFRVFIPLGKPHLPPTPVGAARARTSTAVGAMSFVEEAMRWLPGEDRTAQRGLRTEISGADILSSSYTALSPQPSVLGTGQPPPLVLLADDNADMREYLGRLLSSQGYQVESVSNGQAALDRAHANPPDIVLTDVMMPRLDGFGLLKALRDNERTRTVPIIMLSARAGEEARVEGLGAGADDYLIKPFSARELLARVRSHLDLARLRRENEERVSGILGSITDGFQIIDAGYRFEYFNAAARRTFVEQGMNPDELIGRHILDEVFPAEQDKPWAAALRRTMSERISTEVEMFYEPWQCWFAARYYPAPDGGVSVFFQNITERKRAGEALRQSEERFARFMQHLPGLAWIKDEQGRYVYANDAAQYTFQIPKERLYGKTDEEVFPPEVAAQFRENDRFALTSGTGVQVGETLEHQDGSLHHSLVSKFPIPGSDGQTALIGGIGIDITDRKQAEKQLRHSEQELADFFENATVGLHWVGPDGIILRANRAELNLLGYAVDEYVGHHIAEFHADQDVIGDILRRLTAGEELQGYEARLRCKDGSVRHVLISSNVLWEDDRFVHTRCFTRDITERKRTEERLAQFTAELEQRVSERTYELAQSEDRLRTLATDLNLAEQRERKRLATELHDHLQQTLVLGKLTIGQGKRVAAGVPPVEQMLKKVDDIFSDALTYTRTLVSDLSPTVLRDHGLAAALQWLGAYMQKYNQTVTVTVPDGEDLKLPEDQVVLLFQSVRELLINSAKHAGTGQATVTLEQRDGLLKIDVRDEGAGLDLAAAAAATPSGGISSKFGLFSIQERMRALGGSFDLQSAPGHGTIATLMLPVQRRDELDKRDMRDEQHAISRPVSLLSPATQHAPIRVLLVDDHIMVRQGLRTVLDAYADIELVGEAGNGKEAIQMVDQLRPGVVVMDINMPKMNGIEATVHIKLRHPETIVIGLSVNAAGENQEAMKRAGAVQLMTKEAVVEELYAVIMRHVGRAKESDSSPHHS